MPFQPVEDGLGITINADMGSIPFVNVFGLVFTGTLTQGIADTIADSFVTAYDEIAPVLNNTWALQSIVVTDLREEEGAQFTVVGAPSLVVGEKAVDALPFQTAALVTWYTAVRGRSFRGRTYLGGFCEDGSSGRSIAGAVQTALEGFAAQITLSGEVGIISRFHGVDEDGVAIPRNPAIITPITSALVHPNWRTQRRRALLAD